MCTDAQRSLLDCAAMAHTYNGTASYTIETPAYLHPSVELSLEGLKAATAITTPLAPPAPPTLIDELDDGCSTLERTIAGAAPSNQRLKSIFASELDAALAATGSCPNHPSCYYDHHPTRSTPTLPPPPPPPHAVDPRSKLKGELMRTAIFDDEDDDEVESVGQRIAAAERSRGASRARPVGRHGDGFPDQARSKPGPRRLTEAERRALRM